MIISSGSGHFIRVSVSYTHLKWGVVAIVRIYFFMTMYMTKAFSVIKNISNIMSVNLKKT